MDQLEKKMKRSLSVKMMLPGKKKKKKKNDNENQNVKPSRILITVNVLGSSGPMRLLVNDDDSVSCVIDLCLKLYARVGRLPVLGSDFRNFMLYPSDAELDLNEAIGSCGERTFLLCKKQNSPQAPTARSQAITRQSNTRIWKTFFLCLVQ